jgi:uncharacterized surface protein with fasciclin (FAS1) repeats
MTTNKVFTPFTVPPEDAVNLAAQQNAFDFNTSPNYKIWKELLDLVSGDPAAIITNIISGKNPESAFVLFAPTDNAVTTALGDRVLTYLKDPANKETLIKILDFHFIRSDSTLYNKIGDDLLRLPGVTANRDNLPGDWSGSAICSATQAERGQCNIPVYPINSVMIPKELFPELNAIYGIGNTTSSKQFTKNTYTQAQSFPKWLKKPNNNNNIN